MIFSYTNHALDQVLLELHEYFPDLVRCGRNNRRKRHGAEDVNESDAAASNIRSLDQVSKEFSYEYEERNAQISRVSVHAIGFKALFLPFVTGTLNRLV